LARVIAVRRKRVSAHDFDLDTLVSELCHDLWTYPGRELAGPWILPRDPVDDDLNALHPLGRARFERARGLSFRRNWRRERERRRRRCGSACGDAAGYSERRRREEDLEHARTLAFEDGPVEKLQSVEKDRSSRPDQGKLGRPLRLTRLVTLPRQLPTATEPQRDSPCG
jgi:hypothetical protein